MTTVTVTENPIVVTVSDVGIQGAKGDTGAGVPVGGTTGQVLEKNSNADLDVKWATPQYGVTDHTLLSNIGTNTHAQIDSHVADINNPHSVTKAQVGLGNADNTSDANKPISIATQTALNNLQALSIAMAAAL